MDAAISHASWQRQSRCTPHEGLLTRLPHKRAAGLQAVVAGVAMVKNAALSRALRCKDQEMNQLILMVRAPAYALPDVLHASALCVYFWTLRSRARCA